MIGVSFYAEARTNCGRQVSTKEWESLSRAFGVDTIICIDQLNFECFGFSTSMVPNAFTVQSIQEIRDQFPDALLVFVDSQGISLYDFTHPDDDVIYLFGANSGGFRKQADGIDGERINILTDTDHSIWASQAATIVLADRYQRGNNR